MSDATLNRDLKPGEARIAFWKNFVRAWERDNDRLAGERIMELLDELEEHLRKIDQPAPNQPPPKEAPKKSKC